MAYLKSHHRDVPKSCNELQRSCRRQVPGFLIDHVFYA
jgi:hypothetical protein